MTSMASSIQPRPPAMRDLRSGGELSRSHSNGDGRCSTLFKIAMALGRARYAAPAHFVQAQGLTIGTAQGTHEGPAGGERGAYGHVVLSSVSGVRGAIDALRNSQNNECQF